ncbi:MAG: preprotein translocase subunit SecA, partial [Flavobacteriales bacterium]
KDIEEINVILEPISDFSRQFLEISNDDLRQKTLELKSRISEHISAEQQQIDEMNQRMEDEYEMDADEKEELYNKIDKLEKKITEKTEDILLDILPMAFAVVKETARRFKENEALEVTATDFDRDIAAKRDSVRIEGDKAIWYNKWMAAGNEITWDMVHFDVQLIGGVALHQGRIAEMATGEGKTLVATLPVYLNALPGKGVHLVTVNDYLARRDAEWMGPIFEFHGLSVDCIDLHEPHSDARRKAYLADITYGTNNEFGFDYLRDNMSSNPDELVQRKHNYSIVDEVDSVLIDEARTPLIISGPTPRGEQHEFDELKPRVERLVKAQRELIHGLLLEARKKLETEREDVEDKKEFDALRKEGSLALLRCYRGLPKYKPIIKYLSEPGVKTQLQKTEAFYLQDNAKEMPTVDAELFFTIEEKHNTVEIQEKGIDLITGAGDDPNLFIMPDIGTEIAEIEKSGLSPHEIAQKKDALLQDYAVKSERLHTIHQLLKAYALFEKDVEYVILDNKVKIVDEQTGRIMEGRRYSDGLHQAIEAKENVKIEAATQTYATVTLQNYFRMYNKLAGMTGTAETEAGEFWEIYKLDVVVIPTNKPMVRDDREDLVYKTAREKYNAVIDEIGKLVDARRPVLVGTTSVEVSELLSRMLKMRNIRHNVLNAKQHQREAQIVAEAGQAGTVTIATNMAGRGTDIKLGEGVKDAGGLAIVGTERHESRRVDRQLRGRAGRQGDPGSSQFFVSLEDNLMRLFGSERIARLMDRLGIEEGEVIQHSMVSKSIERAQKKVEENNFGIRKRLLEYDDVMNNQREVIYRKRRNALYGQRISLDIANAMYEVCESIAAEYQDLRDYEGFAMETLRLMAIEPPIAEDEFISLSVEQIAEKVCDKATERYQGKLGTVANIAFPVIKNVYENQSATYKNIAIPFTDGMKTLQVGTNLELAYKTDGREVGRAVEKAVTLAMIDGAWKEHLREMDDLRQSVQNAVYEQKDPLLIYKFESYELFKTMVDKTNKELISFLMKANIPQPDPAAIREAEQQRTDMSRLQTSKDDVPGVPPPGQRSGEAPPMQRPQRVQPVRVEKKIGRNEPCHCGSGKKYKHCHGRGK